VSAEIKLELLGLIDRAVAEGWAHTRACRVLDLADSRAHHWRARLRETGTLQDGDPGGGAVHGILEWEEQAILDLIEAWGPVDRSHRKLAHRGSYIGQVFVSPSTVLRVALKNRVKLPGEPFRPRPGKPAFPEVPWEKNRIWIWDASHFTRCQRVAYAIVDVVTRYWIGYLLTSEQTHTQVQLLFVRALEDQGLLGPDGLPPERDDEGPILVAWSDNGAEMTAIDTRQFMALMAIAQHHRRHADRPGARRVVLQPPEGRLAATDDDHRPRRARCRARPDPRPVQHGQVARLDRLRRPRRRALRPRARDPPRPCRGPETRPLRADQAESSQQVMTTLPSIDHAHLPLGKRGAFEGVARRPWMAGGMGTDDAQNPGNHQPHHNPQRWVEKCDRSVANSETPQGMLEKDRQAPRQHPYLTRRAPAKGQTLRRRQDGQPAPIIEIAWQAQRRLHRVWQRLDTQRGKRRTIVAVAVARELAGFCWALANAA
jgi:putative transposase